MGQAKDLSLRATEYLSSHRTAREALWLPLASVLSFVIFSVFLGFSCFNCNEKALFLDMVQEKARKPFVQRMLVPAAVRSVVAVFPDSAAGWAVRLAAKNHLVRRYFEERKWELEHTLEYLVLSVILYLSLLGYTLALRSLLAKLYPASGWYPLVVPLLSLFSLPPFFFFSYVYDLPQLFLFTLGLTLMARRRWIAFLLVFLLAVLNKETSGLLLLVFVLHFWPELSGRQSRIHLVGAAQLLLFLVTRAMIHQRFFANPGDVMGTYLIPHVRQLLEPYSFPAAFIFLLTLVLTFHRWHAKPAFLRDGLVIFPVLFAAFVPFGYMGEIRVFYEAFPIVFCLVAHSFTYVLGAEPVTTATA